MREEKKVSYQTTNTYQTLNEFTKKTKNVWLVCHGLGYLSSYFLNHFESLNAAENYIVAPQAPSKYYQDKRYKYVGASWVTRINTEDEIENVLNYLDAVYKSELEPKLNCRINFVVLGFSQGVSIVTRWLAYRKQICNTLVLHSGSIPKNLNTADFSNIRDLQTFITYGLEDEYLTPNKLEQELEFVQKIFGENIEKVPFEGKHTVSEKAILQVADKFKTCS
ncbi:putative esterase [Leeuwenhoekiella aestuarii]|uniref:Putative esterase n=1 Tax=Leeuwenhoekiella aestuarii TaxID=2249426 RepID=A0A4Q0NY22_9FLAO|nr:esterase [Leeuwenhoekiella aestuarii]RXG16251.1 putative esterase [Leeuwenhoekiella aestuarii]RXG16944.1 putative esterase [Leeuwenhoekiella aestuarii]